MNSKQNNKPAEEISEKLSFLKSKKPGDFSQKNFFKKPFSLRPIQFHGSRHRG